MATLEQLKKGVGMDLANYIDADLVAFLDVGSRKEAIEQLVATGVKRGKIQNKETFLRAIFEREGMVSTGIGMGIAIPHARLPEYQTFFIIVGICHKGVLWDSIDGLPVRIIFLVGGPASQQNEYLKLLSKLTEILNKEEIRSQLINSREAEKVTNLLECGS